MSHNEALFISLLVIALLIVLRVRRIVREQRFGVVTMWVIPVLFACLTAAIMVAENFTTPSDIGLAVLSLALGAAIGFYQGTLALGINVAGAITGVYYDANNVAHGYLVEGELQE